MREFGLSQVQAQAILEMQLQRLTGLERQKILDELAELLKTIEHLRGILASDERLMQLIVDELRRSRPSTPTTAARRSSKRKASCAIEDLIAEEDVAITVSDTGYIKRTAITTYRSQRRGGRGRIGMKTQGRGLRRPPLRRVDARLPDDLLGSRAGVLAQGPRDPGGRRGRQGQGDREPGLDAAARADRSGADRSRLGRGQVRRHGDAARRHQEDGAHRLQQPTRRAASSPWASRTTTR